MDGFRRCRPLFEIDESLHAVGFRESLDAAFLVLKDATQQVVRHADVKRAPWTARQDVDVEFPPIRHPRVIPTKEIGSPGRAARAV